MKSPTIWVGLAGLAVGYGVGHYIGLKSERNRCPTYETSIQSIEDCQVSIAESQNQLLDLIFKESVVRECTEGLAVHEGDLLGFCGEMIDEYNERGREDAITR